MYNNIITLIKLTLTAICIYMSRGFLGKKKQLKNK